MGCTSSREARRERRRSPSAYFRSQSMPVPSSVGGSSRRVGDSNRHIVALTSSTLGSLRLDDYVVGGDEMMMKSTNDGRRSAGKEPNAKAWSEMIEAKIPKTPTTPVAETINTWELMAGLEEAEAEAKTTPVPERPASPPKPVWMHASPEEEEEEEPIVPDFDPDILSNFRKALDQLSPQHRTPLRSPTVSCKPEPDGENGQSLARGTVKARITAFQQKIDAKRRRRCPPGGEGKVVLYLTSLRGVRRTYEECWGVRVILQGYGVRVDERDVSMHAGFKDELEEVLGQGFGGSRLPRVFANSKYLGGAEEVRGMHEAGELGRALEGCEAAATVSRGGDCEGCGGVRFVPCDNCSGSCKVYVEEEEEVVVVGVGGFRRCPECNENGLVRCPFCW